MSKTVTIIDHGTGNLFSVARAVEACGGVPVLADTPEAVRAADKLILPGVGAFGNGMAHMVERGLVEPLREKVAAGTELLAICLGMQMLFTESTEFGAHQGLDLLPGRVVSLLEITAAQPCQIPQIGWNGLHRGPTGRTWDGTRLAHAADGDDVYFVHSFAVAVDRPADVLAVTRVGTVPVTAVVARDNITGCQFHPEKSGPVGLGIIRGLVAA